jgi:hypothetical protein
MNTWKTDPIGRDAPVVTADGAVRELEKESLAESSDHTSPELRDLPPLGGVVQEVYPLAKDPDGAPEEPEAEPSDISNQ